MSLYGSFRDRVKTAVSESYDLSQIPKWICDHTYIKGAKYSFVDHEFQETIVSDTSRIVNVQKCSQVGLSEVMARWTTGVCEVFPGFSVIVTFPFSGDAQDFAKTRIDPFIESSPRLRDAMSKNVNNTDIKQIHESFIYFRGTNGKTQAISTPADAIVSDEIDKSDPAILTTFTSRLTHSKFKLRRNFSTPTQEGFGIALEMETSRRFKNLCRCSHCNHWFLPDYFEHVKIPGFDGDLRTLNRITLPKTRYLEAELLCPSCFKAPDLGVNYRQWVQENTDAQFEAAGYFVSPFDAPAFITVPDLLVTSTSYAKYSEFVNQNLGKTAVETSEALTLHDLNEVKVVVDLKTSQAHAMGCDMGLMCHICIGRLTLEGQFLVVHRERVALGNFEKRVRELKTEYRVLITVCDSMPYVDLILRMQTSDKNLYGAVFTNSKKLEVFSIKMFEGKEEEGKLPIHMALVNREKAFDELLGKFKERIDPSDITGTTIMPREVVISQQDEIEDELFDKHALDMKRVQEFDKDQELTYVWKKSPSAQDHYWHALLYLYTACRLRGLASRSAPLGRSAVMRKFKVQQPVEQRGLYGPIKR